MAKAAPDPQDSEGVKDVKDTPKSDADQDPAPAEDDVKRRFREALDRKHQANTDSAGDGGARNGSKIRGAHGAAGHQRQFRRKSG